MGILSAITGGLGLGLDFLNAKKNRDKQDQYALNAVTYKARDSMNAYKETGIHPLVGMGTNTMSFSPVEIGGAAAMSDIGQNLDRAVEATTNGTQRSNSKVALLQLERAGLENDLLRSQIASTNAQLRAQIGPPLPSDGGAGQLIPGQGNSLIPSKVVDPQLTKGLNAFGKGISVNPNFSDAQTIEDRYGDSEILSMLSALVNSGADAYWNMYRPGMGKKRPFRNPMKMGR